MTGDADALVVRGARVHNLRSVDVTIPRGKLVVITGPSGSGKSSLAFDTIYAEGQRRYVESLSAYARQFLERLAKPDVDALEGLSPAIAIQQQAPGRNPRSTVGTVTEVHDYLRLLYARLGEPHCPRCGSPVEARTVQQIVDDVLSLPEGSRFSVLAPMVRGAKGDLSKVLTRLRKEGFVRVRIDGELHDLGDEIHLDRRRKHTLEVYVDRLSVKPDVRQRLTESVELALGLADGLVVIAPVDGHEQLVSERLSCPGCGVSLAEITPRTFSFNSPAGACPGCGGIGRVRRFEPELVVPDSTRSIREGAIAPWGKPGASYHRHMLADLSRQTDADPSVPWEQLPAPARRRLLYGEPGGYEGILPGLERRAREYERRKREEGASEERMLEFLEEELGQYATHRTCPACGGARLRSEALAVVVGRRSIDEVSRMPISELIGWLDGLSFEPARARVANKILAEVRARAGFLADVGLGYLSLGRGASTLSGGEAERIRLATQIGSGLVGVLYVLDEPSIGLHPRDNARLIATLERLRDRGNTVLVVEHDPETIAAADYVVDMGPGAGRGGGEVVATGTPEEIARDPASLTGAFLSGRRQIPVPSRRRVGQGELLVEEARTHNLESVDVAFPLCALTCITGVSGSGKSSLVVETLLPLVRHALGGAPPGESVPARIEGVEQLERVVAVDQGPIGRTPRSNPATYTGLFAVVRELFATLPEARARGYKPGRFSFNVKGGRCEACRGDGVVRVEMYFLPDVYVECEQCGGRRYNRETLEVRYRGYSIADVLDMQVDYARTFFEAVPRLRERLDTLHAVGLGYLELGRPATTLSGGEAQRVKLARELGRRTGTGTLYVLDEPTTGLHPADVELLVQVLDQLVEAGHTVLVIEHNLDVIKIADHVVDLGPEGGEGGGRVVVTGTPEEVAAHPDSHTGAFLRRVLRTTG